MEYLVMTWIFRLLGALVFLLAIALNVLVWSYKP